MGLSNFHCAAEGVLPILVMNTVFTIALLRNMVRSVIGAIGYSNLDEESDRSLSEKKSRERRVSITQFKALCGVGGSGGGVECCVCLCRFEAEEEVSELPCKHFFHKKCLEKWFDNKNSSCPLCRSVH